MARLRIFKYTGHAEAIIRNRKVKLSSAHLLNDPFELSPRIEPASVTPKRAAVFLRREDQVRHWFEKEGLSNGFRDLKAFRRWYLANLPARISWLMKEVPENVESARVRFAEMFSEHWRLFCASKRKDSVLMWSHYALEHKGAVIEFDTAENPFRQLGTNFVFEIAYTNEKANFDYNPEKTKPFMAAVIEVARRKSPEWAYEEEVRAIFPGIGEFFPLNPASVKSLTLGCRCPEAKRNSLLELLSNEGFAHVSISQAKLNKNCFNLDFESIRTGSAIGETPRHKSNSHRRWREEKNFMGF